MSGPPVEVLAYVTALAERLNGVPSAHVHAVHLHGSAALGGWNEAVSDVDVLVVLAGPVDPATASALAVAAVQSLPACPGTGLELSAVTRAEAAAPRHPWRFVVHVAATGGGEPSAVLGEGHPGDPDLRLHYAVCRADGYPLLGPPAAEVIGPVPRAAILLALAQELAWGLEHAPGPYALLNACRALVYLQDGRFVAKTSGGRWALDHSFGPPDGIARALAAQAGGAPAAALTGPDVAFVRRTAQHLRARDDG